MPRSRALVGPVAAGLLGLALVVPTTTPASAGDLPERTVSSKIVETQRNRLLLKGNVSPGHALAPVFVQKRNCPKKRCEWRTFAKVRTNENGGFRTRVTAPRTGYDYWRDKVPARDGYATSYSEVWRTYTI